MKKLPVAKTLILGSIFAISTSVTFMYVAAPDGFEPLFAAASGTFDLAVAQTRALLN